MIGRWHHPHWKLHMLGVLQGLAELADGCVTLLTLATCTSGFEHGVARYRAKTYFQIKKGAKK